MVSDLTNSWTKILQKVKTLAPKAQVSGATNGIPTTSSQVTLTKISVTGIKYKLVLENPNFSFAPGSGENSQPSVTANIEKESGLIYLVSSVYHPYRNIPAGYTACGGQV